MQLLLLSSSRTPAGYLTDYLPAIREFCAGVRRAAFIPYAAVALPWDEYRRRVTEAIGFRLEENLEDADLVVVGGGNTFQLLRECRSRGLLEKLRARVSSGAAKYLGWSAGANLACPTIMTTNDMPIVDPGGFGALNLVRFQINPHYLSVALPGHHWLRVSDSEVRLCGPHPAMAFEGERHFVLQPGAWPPVDKM